MVSSYTRKGRRPLKVWRYLYELPRFAGVSPAVKIFRELHGFVNLEEITKTE